MSKLETPIQTSYKDHSKETENHQPEKASSRLNGAEILAQAPRLEAGDRTVKPPEKFVTMPPASYPSENATSRKEKTHSTDAKSAGKDTERTVVYPGNERLEPDAKPSITVQLSDQSANPKQPPTFKISREGNVLDSEGNPVKNLDFSKGQPKNIVIHLEHTAADDLLPKEKQEAQMKVQQEALSSFVQGTLNSAIRKDQPEIAQRGINVDDRQQLLTDEAKAAVQKAEVPAVAPPLLTPPKDFSPQEQASANSMNGRMPDNSSGSLTRSEADNFYPQRDVPTQRGETNEILARKEAMAAAFSPDKDHPYETIRQTSNGAYAVGRYGESYDHLNNVMNGVLQKVQWPQWVLDSLGHPPDWSKLSKIMKDHPELLKDAEIAKQIKEGVQQELKNGELPASLADKFKDANSLGEFADFVNKLKGKDGAITSEELKKNLPKEAQEQLAQNTAERGIKTGASAAETVLAQHLGKQPDQLSDQEKHDPNNKEFLEAANKYYKIAAARQQPGPDNMISPGDSIDWKTLPGGKVTAKMSALKEAALSTSSDMQTVGKCAAGVQVALDKIGYSQFMGSGNAWDMGKVMAGSGKFDKVPLSQAQEGDIIVRSWNRDVINQHGGNNWGDIVVVTSRDSSGNLMGANDHHGVIPPDGDRYRDSYVLRLRA